MNIEAKRNELIQWILNINEDVLSKVSAIKEKTVADEIVSYSTKGESFTKKQYVKHINDIRESVKNGAKTYTTEEVREYVLNSKRA